MGYPHFNSATAASLRISSLSGHGCDVWALQLCKTIDCFSPLVSCIAFSGPQGGGFQVSSSWINSSPVSKIGGVFSNGVLPSSSGRTPKTKLIAAIISGDQDLKRSFPMPGTGGFVRGSIFYSFVCVAHAYVDCTKVSDHL